MKLRLNEEECKNAGIPEFIRQTNKTFERNVTADADGKVALATSKQVGERTVGKHCLVETLALGTKLFLKTNGRGANTNEKQRALKAFHITIAQAK
jgi:hypothetical protein